MSQSPQLRFENLGHQYFIGEKRYPGITELLKEFNLIPELKYYTDHSRDRGHAFHLARQFYDEGTLDIDTIDPQIRGHVDAYIEYRKQFPCKFLLSEVRMVSHLHRFCGTPDALVHDSEGFLLEEYKTGAPHETVRLQTAGQLRLVQENYPQFSTLRRRVIQFKSNGKYSVKDLPMENIMRDQADFEALVRCHWLKRGE